MRSCRDFGSARFFPSPRNPKIKHIPCFYCSTSPEEVSGVERSVGAVSNDTQIYIETDARRQEAFRNCKRKFVLLTPNLIHIQGTPAEYKLRYILRLSLTFTFGCEG